MSDFQGRTGRGKAEQKGETVPKKRPLMVSDFYDYIFIPN
jgi:hypothetical protein